MNFGDKDIRRISVIIIVLIVGVLAFIAVKSVLYSVIGGLILAYILNPVYRKVNQYVNHEGLSAIIVLILAIAVIAIPLWFITPLVIQQFFEIYQASQSLDVYKFLSGIFPTASEQFLTQVTLTLSTLISKAGASMLNFLISIFLDIPNLLVHIFLVGFVLFYALRDSDRLLGFVSGLSPFNKEKEKGLVVQFKGITDSIVYGLFIVGLVQGILAGIGLLIFGVDNALVLTILATIFSIIPILGPYIVWVPVTIFLFASGNVGLAAGYFFYNLLIVSTLDNILRSWLVSRKTSISPAIVMIGMFGGLFVFGIMGILLGPLILVYFLTFLKSYKEGNLYSLFSEESIKSTGK